MILSRKWVLSEMVRRGKFSTRAELILDRLLSQRHVGRVGRERKEERKEGNQLTCTGAMEATMNNDEDLVHVHSLTQ